MLYMNTEEFKITCRFSSFFPHLSIPLGNNPSPGLATSPFFRIERLPQEPVYISPPAAVYFSFPSWCWCGSSLCCRKCEKQQAEQSRNRPSLIELPDVWLSEYARSWSDWICHCGALYRPAAANRSSPFHRLPCAARMISEERHIIFSRMKEQQRYFCNILIVRHSFYFPEN